jgi:A/G-specific adenine glycosylase
MSKLNKRQVTAFVKLVMSHYRDQGRHALPWRHVNDPYAILVSEIMLQQTQVDRVIPKYVAFIERFPTPQALAQAPLVEVLRLWVGLGYNRRALYLQKAAQVLALAEHYPQSVADWQRLPGVGPYTAAAVCAFAYDQLVSLIETNVRTVFIHHFFADKKAVTDIEIMGLVSQVLPQVGSARLWYYALMDYGSFLKKQVGNLNRNSKHYTKQPQFNGSNRQVRGRIIRELTKGALTKQGIIQALPGAQTELVEVQLTALVAEGLIQKERNRYQIAT